MRRIGYLFLNILLIVSLLPVSVFADEAVTDDKDDLEFPVEQSEETEDLNDKSVEEVEGQAEKKTEVQEIDDSIASEEQKDKEKSEVQEDTIIRNEIDISDLTEEELQYVPEAQRDNNVIVEEIPQSILEEEGPRARSAYPNVNNYIRQKGWNVSKIKYDHKSQFTKFQYRNFRPEGVVAHETANNNSTIDGEINYMSRNHKNAFVHAFVDHNNIIEIHPIGLGAWGAGHVANARYVHVELVRVHSFDQFAKSINNYADYIAYVLYQSNLPVTNAETSGKGTLWSHNAVSKHLGGTTHVDPHGYFSQYGYNWGQFVELVKERHQQYVKGGPIQHVSNPKVLYSDEVKDSRLGQISNSNAKIYKEIGNDKTSLKASSYLNEVFYIKKRVVHFGDTHYLLARSPSASKNTIGWIKSRDLKSYAHKGLDKNRKTFLVKGTGHAYNKAWGGSKNHVYNLSALQGETFTVNLTEAVGENVWYRGNLKGKQVWIHSSYLSTDQSTSMLGHLRSGNVKIYDDLHLKKHKTAKEYTNAVYYIKRQAVVNNEAYYLISTNPSATKGVVGWVRSKDLSTHSHVGVNRDKQTYIVRGSGNAYTKAWGGNKDLVYNLKDFRGEEFHVHLTEKVGNNTWHRGVLNGETVFVHSSYLTSIEKSKTSKLGHIRNANNKIYKTITEKDTAFKAGSEYTNTVYYIKEKALFDKETYYKISTSPSATKGVVGWVKAKDMSTHIHTGVNRDKQTFIIRGTGKAYTKAWGGNKNLVYNLKDHAGEEFNVHLTEKVGNNIWYRGILNGKTVFIHSSYLTSIEKTKTSKLGHIRSGNVRVYSKLGGTESFSAGDDWTNKVYYIKEQGTFDNQLYYLISEQPSSEKGIVGWVKAEDLSTHSHVGVDRKDKMMYIKGTGKAFKKAWGGNKDQIYNLSEFKNQLFRVHLTERVGNNLWYRGTLDGKTVWIHSSYVESRPIKKSKTSKLGHIRNANNKIYKTIADESSVTIAGATYTNAVYYIKEEAIYNKETYYKISTSPSASKGVLGWMKARDLSTHNHVGKDRIPKAFYIKGIGKAYTKAWGGNKDLVYDLKDYKNQTFKVHLTEKVGSNIWYRGVLGGKTVWIHSSYIMNKK